MPVCFGFSWPFAILMTPRVKNPAGKKSHLLMTLVIVGRFAGAPHRILHNREWAFYLYVLHALPAAAALCPTSENEE